MRSLQLISFSLTTLILLLISCTGAASSPESTLPAIPPTPDISDADELKLLGEASKLLDHLYTGTDSYPWWNDTVFYEIFVRSFYDSDGDGIGDLNGIIEKLDYLNDGDLNTSDDLGVTGIWLMPIMESPSYHGYDVVDYFTVDQEYGSNDDLRRLISEAHEKGIRVVVDLVLNHTSREHPWFEASMESDSEFRNWYIWLDEHPKYPGPWGQEVWHKERGDYYYGLFWEGMPDLNYENPEVTAAMNEIAGFWLEDMGIDGFRLDAIRHLVEDGPVQENTAATHEWLEGFFDFYKGVNPGALAVGEAWTSTEEILEYIGDEVDIAFQFDLASAILSAAASGLGKAYTQEMRSIVDTFPANQYATFITNHDQNRVMTALDGDTGAAKVASSLLLTGPGVPFVYYGEELGMKGEKPDEDIRRPMQWSDENKGAGFSSGRPWRPPYEDYEERNVEFQDEDPDSILNHYRELINLRNQHDALRIGDWILVESSPEGLITLLRTHNEDTLLILINPSRSGVIDYRLDLESGPFSQQPSADMLFGEGQLIPPIINEPGGFSDYRPLESLPSQSTFVIKLSP